MSRKEKKYHFIYKTTNILTKRYYYGMHSSNNLDDGYLGSGKRLRYSVRKYGKENHEREIVEFCKTRKELKDREREIVNCYFGIYGSSMTLESIGEEMGLTKERIRQIKESAIRKIRNNVGDIFDYLVDEDDENFKRIV